MTTQRESLIAVHPPDGEGQGGRERRRVQWVARGKVKLEGGVSLRPKAADRRQRQIGQLFVQRHLPRAILLGQVATEQLQVGRIVSSQVADRPFLSLPGQAAHTKVVEPQLGQGVEETVIDGRLVDGIVRRQHTSRLAHVIVDAEPSRVQLGVVGRAQPLPAAHPGLRLPHPPRAVEHDLSPL